jgi:hypothetical protein
LILRLLLAITGTVIAVATLVIVVVVEAFATTLAAKPVLMETGFAPCLLITTAIRYHMRRVAVWITVFTVFAVKHLVVVVVFALAFDVGTVVTHTVFAVVTADNIFVVFVVPSLFPRIARNVVALVAVTPTMVDSLHAVLQQSPLVVIAEDNILAIGLVEIAVNLHAKGCRTGFAVRTYNCLFVVGFCTHTPSRIAASPRGCLCG